MALGVVPMVMSLGGSGSADLTRIRDAVAICSGDDRRGR
jgi:hypothetical protein